MSEHEPSEAKKSASQAIAGAMILSANALQIEEALSQSALRTAFLKRCAPLKDRVDIAALNGAWEGVLRYVRLHQKDKQWASGAQDFMRHMETLRTATDQLSQLRQPAPGNDAGIDNGFVAETMQKALNIMDDLLHDLSVTHGAVLIR